MEKVIVVLDSFEYKKKETEIKSYISNVCEPTFVYTKYENFLIRFFQKTKYIGNILSHLSYWFLSFYYSIVIATIYHHKKYSTIIFINPIVGIFFSMLKRICHFKKKVTIGGFLFEKKKNRLYSALRKGFVNFSYKQVDKIFVYGKNEIDLYNQIFPQLYGKFDYVRYGKDFHSTNKTNFSYNKDYICSGGRSNRNYSVLCQAMQILSKGGFTDDCFVATSPKCVTKTMENSNVKFIYDIKPEQFGRFIKGSKLFVLPLLNTHLSAGHMAMLEAMSVMTPIIVSDIPSIRNYVSEQQVFFFNPNDSQDLANKILIVLNDLNKEYINEKVKIAKELYDTEYSFKALLKRIVTKSLL